MGRRYWRLPRLGPALILLALTIAVFWKVALTGQYTWLNGPDLTEQVLPFLQEEARQWHQGEFPLWDPHHWAGQSLLGQDQPGVLYPLNWLLSLAPYRHGHISLQFMNWYFVLVHYLAALFAYLLARDLALGEFASICAGASFGLSGYMGTIEWPQMLNGALWAPLVLLFAIRALNGRRPLWNMALSGAIAGFSFYGGHHQIPMYTLLCVGVFLGFYVVFRGMPLRTAALLGVVCAGFAVLIGAPQLIPSYEYWARSLRWVSSANPVGFKDQVPYVVFDLFSMNPVTVLGLVVPSTFPNITPYVGVTILSCAIFAVAANWRARMVAPFAALGIFGLFFSLGKYSVFHGILYSVVPLLDKSRNAAFAMLIANLAIAILAGFGIECLLTERESVRRAARGMAIVLLSAGALIWTVLLARGVFDGDKMFQYPAFAQLALSAVFAGCLFLAWAADHIPARGAKLGLICLVLFDIGMVTTGNYPHREQGWPYVDSLSAYDDLADYLHQQPGPFRIYRNSADISFNFGDWYGFDEFGGMGAGMTENMYAMNGPSNAFPILGVSYYLSRTPKDSGSEPVFRGKAGVNIYRMPGAFPRAWVVHRVESLKDRAERFGRINAPLDQLATSSFVVGAAPQVAECGGDKVQITSLRPADIEIDVNMACQGMVVVSDNFFPGWRAEVDGRGSPTYEAYSFVEGVEVPEGTHHLRLHYVPLTLYAGLGLTVLGLVGLALLRRREPHVSVGDSA